MREEINFIIPSCMVASGIIVGVFIAIGRVQQGALLIIAPMIMGGCWLLAIAYIRRRNGRNDSGNNNHTK